MKQFNSQNNTTSEQYKRPEITKKKSSEQLNQDSQLITKQEMTTLNTNKSIVRKQTVALSSKPLFNSSHLDILSGQPL